MGSPTPTGIHFQHLPSSISNTYCPAVIHLQHLLSCCHPSPTPAVLLSSISNTCRHPSADIHPYTFLTTNFDIGILGQEEIFKKRLSLTHTPTHTYTLSHTLKI